MWPLYFPITYSVAATVVAVTIDGDARAAGLPANRRRLLVALGAALPALLVLPFGIGSRTWCSTDTGGAFRWGPLWWLGVGALVPVAAGVMWAFRVAGGPGQRPWNLTALVVALAIATFLVEAIGSAFSVLALCDPGSATLLVVQVVMAAAVPVVGTVAVTGRRR